jgi:hypothetical protein
VEKEVMVEAAWSIGERWVMLYSFRKWAEIMLQWMRKSTRSADVAHALSAGFVAIVFVA